MNFVGDKPPASVSFYWQPWQPLRKETVKDARLSVENFREWDDFMRHEREPRLNALKYEVMKKHLKRDHYDTFLQMFAGSLGVNVLACDEFRDVLKLTNRQQKEIDDVYQAAAKFVSEKKNQWQAITDAGAPLDLLSSIQREMTMRQLEYEDKLDSVLTKRQLETVKSWRDRCLQTEWRVDHEVLQIPPFYDQTSKMSQAEYDAWINAFFGPNSKQSKKSKVERNEAE